MSIILPEKVKGTPELPPSLARNPHTKIITVSAGKYKVTMGAQPGSIKLHRDFRLLRLNIGLLKQFAGNDVADRILSKTENLRKEDHEMVVRISVYDALDLIEILHRRFQKDGIRLRIPTEAVIDVFVSSRGNKVEKKGLLHILTSSIKRKFVDTKILEKDFAREHVFDNDVFVARSAEHPTVRAERSPTNCSHLNCLLLEVIVRTTSSKADTLV